VSGRARRRSIPGRVAGHLPVLAFTLALACPLGASAQPEGAAGLGSPAPGVAVPAEHAAPAPVEAGHERVLREDPGAGEIEDEEWQGPRVELGYATYVLGDGFGGGRVHSFEFGGYVPPLSPFRLGGYAEMGARDYSLGQTDGLLRAAIFAGYQQVKGLGPFMPFVAAVGSVGVVLGKRFHTSVREVFRGIGLEAGADVALVRSLWIGLALSYMRAALEDVSFHLLVVRVRIGL